MAAFDHPVTFAELEAVSDQAKVFGGPGFVPEHLALGLTALADTMEGRKQAWQFPYPLPPGDATLPHAIADSAIWAASYNVPSNTAILKRYSAEDVYISTAFEFHSDPDVYDQHRIALLTAKGWADLFIKQRDGQIVRLPASERTAVFAAPGVVHAVTPPLNPSGVRDFLFLGYDHTLLPTSIDTTREVLPSLEFISGILTRLFAE